MYAGKALEWSPVSCSTLTSLARKYQNRLEVIGNGKYPSLLEYGNIDSRKKLIVQPPVFCIGFDDKLERLPLGNIFQ
jgi:hypothetical protein